MSNFDRRHLRYFIAVAEDLHFGRAAQRLHISQPPLSQQIAALEADLSAQLFVRTKRKVVLTAAGHQFLKDARAILADMQQAADRARAVAEGKTGVLNVGLNYTAPLNPILAALFRRFARLYPGIRLELHENTSEKQIDRLQRQTLDICFIWLTRGEESSEIAIEPVNSDMLNLVFGREHVLAERGKISVKDLQDIPIFLTQRQTRMDFYDALLTACQKSGFEPDIRTNIIQFPFILNIVAAGAGIALAPQFLSRLRIESVHFQPCRFLPQKSCMMPFSLAYRAKDPSPAVRNFVTMLKSMKT